MSDSGTSSVSLRSNASSSSLPVNAMTGKEKVKAVSFACFGTNVVALKIKVGVR